MKKRFLVLLVFFLVGIFSFNLSYKPQSNRVLSFEVAQGATTTTVSASSNNWFQNLLDRVATQIQVYWTKLWGSKNSNSPNTSSSANTSGTTGSEYQSGVTSGTGSQNTSSSSSYDQGSSEGTLSSWWDNLKTTLFGNNVATVYKTTTTNPTSSTNTNTNTNPQATQPAPQASAPASQPSSGQTSDQPNGTTKNPYKLEPNQFKKECGQNTYILHWRKGGIEGKDMAAPTKGGGPEGEQNVWQLPTCEELAKCHCCCNTCKIPASMCQQEGWVFNDKGCVGKCNPVCEGNCGGECQKWDKPTPPDKAPLNRDCKCNMEGCPKPEGNKCTIIIKDFGKTQVEYTKRDGNLEQYFKGTGKVTFSNGNGQSDPKSKIKSEGSDMKPAGWVMQLENKPGVCCKCEEK